MSRFFQLSDAELLTYLNTLSPQVKSWRLVHPAPCPGRKWSQYRFFWEPTPVTRPRSSGPSSLHTSTWTLGSLMWGSRNCSCKSLGSGAAPDTQSKTCQVLHSQERSLRAVGQTFSRVGSPDPSANKICASVNSLLAAQKPILHLSSQSQFP